MKFAPCRPVFAFIFGLLRAAIWGTGARLMKHRFFGKIRISSIHPNYAMDAEAMDAVIEALSTIAQVSPARARRIEGCIHLILNVESHNLATYFWIGKICSIDTPKIASLFPVHLHVGISLSIVHEALHGMLFSRGIAYTEENRDRIERLCKREESRLVEKLATDYPEMLDLSYVKDLPALSLDGGRK